MVVENDHKTELPFITVHICRFVNKRNTVTSDIYFNKHSMNIIFINPDCAQVFLRFDT